MSHQLQRLFGDSTTYTATTLIAVIIVVADRIVHGSRPAAVTITLSASSVVATTAVTPVAAAPATIMTPRPSVTSITVPSISTVAMTSAVSPGPSVVRTVLVLRAGVLQRVKCQSDMRRRFHWRRRSCTMRDDTLRTWSQLTIEQRTRSQHRHRVRVGRRRCYSTRQNQC